MLQPLYRIRNIPDVNDSPSHNAVRPEPFQCLCSQHLLQLAAGRKRIQQQALHTEESEEDDRRNQEDFLATAPFILQVRLPEIQRPPVQFPVLSAYFPVQTRHPSDIQIRSRSDSLLGRHVGRRTCSLRFFPI